jgi:hypothetical protein
MSSMRSAAPPISVVPAKAGTHNPGAGCQALRWRKRKFASLRHSVSFLPRRMGPRLREDDRLRPRGARAAHAMES